MKLLLHKSTHSFLLRSTGSQTYNTNPANREIFAIPSAFV